MQEKKAIEPKELEERTEAALHHLEEFQPKETAKEVQLLLEYDLPSMVEEKLKRIQSLLKRYEDDEAEDAFRELLQELQNKDKA